MASLLQLSALTRVLLMLHFHQYIYDSNKPRKRSLQARPKLSFGPILGHKHRPESYYKYVITEEVLQSFLYETSHQFSLMPLRRSTRIGGLEPQTGYRGSGNQSSKPEVHTDCFKIWPTGAPVFIEVGKRMRGDRKDVLEDTLERTFGETSSLTTKTQDNSNTYFPGDVKRPSINRGKLAPGLRSLNPKANPAAGENSWAYRQTDADPETAEPLQDLSQILMSTKKTISCELLPGIRRLQSHLEKRED